MQLDERSSFHEVMTQVQDQHLGELMGRLTETETKLNMAVFHNQKLIEQQKDYEDIKKKLTEIRDKYHALESNVEGVNANLKEARAGRQAAQEQLAKAQEQLTDCCGKPKKTTAKKQVKDGKHNTTEAK